MDVVGPIYRLENARDTQSLSGSDWDMDEAQGLVFYKPAKLLFAILTDDAQTSVPVPIMAFAATPVHHCDGAASIAPDEMKRIAKDAIHWFYLFSDVCVSASPPSPRPDPGWHLDSDDELPF